MVELEIKSMLISRASNYYNYQISCTYGDSH